MHIYFSASVTVPANRKKIYSRIITVLQEKGCSLFTGCIGNEVDADPHDLSWNNYCIRKLLQSDVAVIEASHPSSAAIGIEIQHAVYQQKSLILLYEEGYKPHLQPCMGQATCLPVAYTQKNLERVLRAVLRKKYSAIPQRFTMLLPNHINHHLENISHKGIARSAYIRQLIEQDMD